MQTREELMDVEPLQIGRYALSRFDGSHILIECNGGEGGSFSEMDLEEVIGKFYRENF